MARNPFPFLLWSPSPIERRAQVVEETREWEARARRAVQTQRELASRDAAETKRREQERQTAAYVKMMLSLGPGKLRRMHVHGQDSTRPRRNFLFL